MWQRNTRMNTVAVQFANPSFNYTTSVSLGTGEVEAREYFVGKCFDVGTYPTENLQKVISIEFEHGDYWTPPHLRSGGVN